MRRSMTGLLLTLLMACLAGCGNESTSIPTTAKDLAFLTYTDIDTVCETPALSRAGTDLLSAMEGQLLLSYLAKDPAALISALKQQPGGTIWVCGGASLIQQLMTADAIDAYCFSVIPTMLGDGIRLFPLNPREMRLTLVKTRCYNGITDLIYQRRPLPSPASAATEGHVTRSNQLD